MTTPGKASGRVIIDSKIPRPLNWFRDKNIPAVVDTASAAIVVASDTNTVRTKSINVAWFTKYLKIDRPSYIAFPRSKKQSHEGECKKNNRKD